MNDTQSPNEFTVLDWVGCVWVVMWILPLLFFNFPAALFKDMYQSISAGLPVLTQIVLKPWVGPLLGIFCSGFFALQWVGWFRRRLLRRRIVILLSYFIVSTIDAICVVALYQPVFRMQAVIGG